MAKYATGQFVNGDWWIAPTVKGGSVTITNVTPEILFAPDKPGDMGVCQHGMTIDPAGDAHNQGHGYGHRATGYDATLNAANPALFPLTITPTDRAISLVKTRGPGWDYTTGNYSDANGGKDRPHFVDVSVLTVLPEPLVDSHLYFRPPYMAGEKRIIPVSQVVEANLPSLAPVSGGPTLSQVAYKFKGTVHLDHTRSYQGRYLHPERAYYVWTDKATLPAPEAKSTYLHNYGGHFAIDYCEALCRLMQNDPIEMKREALYGVLQTGIDLYGIRKAGPYWRADGGHNMGRKIMIAFAAVMLNDADMKAVAADPSINVFSENTQVYRSVTGMALYGAPGSAEEFDAVRLGTGNGRRDIRDPYGALDGGEEPGSTYQPIVTGPYVFSSLIARLLPGGRQVWGPDWDFFHEYADRWVDHGGWASPDTDINGVALNRMYEENGVLRPATDFHGQNKNRYYGTGPYLPAFWTAHRNKVAPAFPYYYKRGDAVRRTTANTGIAGKGLTSADMVQVRSLREDRDLRTAGATYTRQHFMGPVYVYAQNVTLVECLIEGGGSGTYTVNGDGSAANGLTLIDCTVDGGGVQGSPNATTFPSGNAPSAVMDYGFDYTLQRCNLWGAADIVKPQGSGYTLIEDCILHTPIRVYSSATSSTHNDMVQTAGSVANVAIRRSTLDGYRVLPDGTTDKASSVLQLGSFPSSTSTLDNYVIEDCYVNGCGYAFTIAKISEIASVGTNAVLRRNRLGLNVSFGLINGTTATAQDGTTFTWPDNVWDQDGVTDGGKTVTAGQAV